MDGLQLGHLAYLVLLGCAVVFWFVADARRSPGRTAQQAVLWGLLFLGVIAAYGLWDNVSQTVLPRQTVNTLADRIEIPRSPDGHYYLQAQINDQPVRFVVDTGASDIVLSRADARAAGINPDTLVYTGRANTANGAVATAVVRLDRFTVGGIEDRNLRAAVTDGDLGISLLGMRYLERFARIEIIGGNLILTR